MGPTPDSLTTLPTATSITLLLKSHKSTTLLSVAPTTTFADVKTLLLLALQSRNITHIGDVALPTSPEEVELGVLADRRDPAKGWVPLWVRERELSAGAGKNAKRGAGTEGGRTSVLNGGVEGAGLGDGTWVAYRFKTAGSTKAAGNADEEDEEDVDMEEDPGWDVVLPSYDEEGDGGR